MTEQRAIFVSREQIRLIDECTGESPADQPLRDLCAAYDAAPDYPGAECGRTPMSEQTYSAWFTEWPSTHVKARQTVEVVPRELLRAAEARLAQIRDLAEGARGPHGTPLIALTRIAKIARAAANGEAVDE